MYDGKLRLRVSMFSLEFCVYQFIGMAQSKYVSDSFYIVIRKQYVQEMNWV